jgi:hypothetical protein
MRTRKKKKEHHGYACKKKEKEKKVEKKTILVLSLHSVAERLSSNSPSFARQTPLIRSLERQGILRVGDASWFAQHGAEEGDQPWSVD